MEEQDQKTATITAEEKARIKERELLAKRYKAKGVQSLSLREYQELEAKKNRSPRLKVPGYIKFIFATPLIIIACFGTIYLPYLIYQVATSKESPAENKSPKKDISLDDLMVKPSAGKPSKTK